MHEYGDPAVLALDDVPDPDPRPGWVTVRLDASALNWHDVLVRRGQYASPMPHVLGADGAGVRQDTGEQVVVLPSLFWGARDSAPSRDFEILGDHVPGTYAELVSVPAECVVPRPAGFGLAEAAAFSLVGVTTFRALFSRGRLTRGESLLVLGASGGVALAAVALGAAVGAHVVVTSSATDKIASACELGAVAGVDHSAEGWVDQARCASPGKEGFDLVLDSVGRWAESLRCVRPGGRLVVLGASVATEATLDIRPYYFGQFELIGTTMGSPRDMADLLALVRDHGVPPPVIDRTYPLDQAAEAHRRLESGAGVGKIVLTHS
jgi:NADPH:quinone reductase-like Zn-dependent oxidoreductase